MPFGAHETMEAHEILVEKINLINHFNVYASQARNPQLLDMIIRQQQEEIRSYNELVAFTRGTNQFEPLSPNTDIQNANHQKIKYGLRSPQPVAPEADAALNDSEIVMAMLHCHKNAARNGAWASLECADPNLRRMFMNSYANCANQAYEVFMFMNQQGLYQVPTMNSRTQQNFMQMHQPTGDALQSQYGVTGNAGATGGYGGYAGATGNPGMMHQASRDNVMYGTGNGVQPGNTGWGGM